VERSNFAPQTLNAEYYGQRATAGGLIIAEASPVAATARGNPATPGIYSNEQVDGWRKVVDAVHAKGGFIFLQLWHVGRCRIPHCSRAACFPLHPQRCRSPARECWR
jgi:N-ethylmaleimide reductase